MISGCFKIDVSLEVPVCPVHWFSTHYHYVYPLRIELSGKFIPSWYKCYFWILKCLKCLYTEDVISTVKIGPCPHETSIWVKEANIKGGKGEFKLKFRGREREGWRRGGGRGGGGEEGKINWESVLHFISYKLLFQLAMKVGFSGKATFELSS